MERKPAWNHYFTTGDRTPLVKAYWKSIEGISFHRYPKQQEDMFQFGMMGLLKAIDKVDRERVKSLDAWVFLNVRGMMFNARQFKPTVSLDAKIDEYEDEPTAFLDLLEAEDSMDDLEVADYLKSLPRREASILQLIHVHGFKRTEIGRAMGLSSMRVGQLEKRAIKIMQTGSSGV